MDDSPTPGPQRSITEGTPVRMPVGRFVTVLIATGAATAAVAAWALDLSRGQAECLHAQAAQAQAAQAQAQAIEEIRQWMWTCDRRLYNVETAVGAKPLARALGPPPNGAP